MILMTAQHARLAYRLSMPHLGNAIMRTIYYEAITPVGYGSDLSIADYKRKANQ